MKKMFAIALLFITVICHGQHPLDDDGDGIAPNLYVAGGIGYNGRPCVNLEMGGTVLIPRWFMTAIVHGWTMKDPRYVYRTLVCEAGLRAYIIPVVSLRNPVMIFGEYKVFLDGKTDTHLREWYQPLPAVGISYAHMIKLTGRTKQDIRIEFAKTFDKYLGFYSVSTFFALTL